MKAKKAWIVGILFLAVFVALAPCVAAQESAAKGSLNGTVVDSTGGAIVGAQTILTGQQGAQSQVTNGQGTFIYQDLIPAEYDAGAPGEGLAAPYVDHALLLNCLLLAATEGMVTGDRISANYHLTWFQALSAPPVSRWETRPGGPRQTQTLN